MVLCAAIINILEKKYCTKKQIKYKSFFYELLFWNKDLRTNVLKFQKIPEIRRKLLLCHLILVRIRAK